MSWERAGEFNVMELCLDRGGISFTHRSMIQQRQNNAQQSQEVPPIHFNRKIKHPTDHYQLASPMVVVTRSITDIRHSPKQVPCPLKYILAFKGTLGERRMMCWPVRLMIGSDTIPSKNQSLSVIMRPICLIHCRRNEHVVWSREVILRFEI